MKDPFIFISRCIRYDFMKYKYSIFLRSNDLSRNYTFRFITHQFESPKDKLSIKLRKAKY